MKKLILAALVLISTTLIAKEPQSLKFKNGKFKIAQFTDVHYNPEFEGCKGSLQLINDVLDNEKPDLVIFSGDIVVCNQCEKGWKDVTDPVIKRKIPFAVTFGNHDDEGNLTREEIYNIVSKLPHNVNGANPSGVKGFSNAALEILGSSTKKPEAICWIFDSNSYSTIKGVGGYGWFEPNQIKWYSDTSEKYTAANGSTPLPSLAFFHIALPEHSLAYNSSKWMVVGDRTENECPPEYNSGMFLEMLKNKDIMGVFVGHDHDNNYVANLENILLGFGKFSGSKATYTSQGSGSRIFELSEGEREFKTWIFNSDKTTIDSVHYPIDYTKDGKLYRNPMLDSISYSFGTALTQQLLSSKLDPADLNINSINQAMKDVLMGKSESEERVNKMLGIYFNDIMASKNEKLVANYIKQGEEYLEKIETENPKVKKTGSGLLYEIVKEGETSKMPTATSNVIVHYKGSLPDGEVFDSSYDRGDPTELNLSRVIEGWSEGIQLIGKGGKINLWIPSNLAYGENGAGEVIPPNTPIHFEIELLFVGGANE